MTYAPAAVAILVAAALHLYVFVQESILFSRPATQRMFEVSPEHAAAVRLWAYHQGVYNALLAGVAIAGAVLLLGGDRSASVALIAASAVCMILAALALLLADARRARVTGFVAQAAPAAVALVLLAFGT
ncbi:MAG: DUF1304 family protein [Leifsonia sp.]